MSHDESYRPGPGRPPREHQFKKGQSGNKNGRPPGRLSLKTVVTQELGAPVTIAQSGETVPVLQALFKTLIHKGLKGNLRAIAMTLEHAGHCLKNEDVPNLELPEEDTAILERLLGSKIDGD